MLPSAENIDVLPDANLEWKPPLESPSHWSPAQRQSVNGEEDTFGQRLRESMEVCGPPPHKATDRKSTRMSKAMDAMLGITESEGRRLTVLEKEIHQAADAASIKLLRRDCLKDINLRIWDSIAWFLNICLGVCISAGPLFAALLIQVVMTAADGEVSIEKALAWEVVYLLFTALIAVGRKVACGHVVRRIIYRLDVGLAHLASLADVGQCSVKVAQQAREARADRVARSSAKACIEMPMEIGLHGIIVVLCLVQVAISSPLLGLCILFIMAIAAVLGVLELRLAILHAELEKRLSRLAEKESPDSGFGRASMLSVGGADRQAEETGSAFGSHIHTSSMIGDKDAQEYLELEAAVATSRSLLRLGQLLFVGNAVLLLLYLGALHVMHNRSSYRPEALLERLFVSIAAVFSFAKVQGCVTHMNNALPQVRVVAHLQQSHFIINPDLVASLKRNQMTLKGASAKRIFFGGTVIFLVVALWLYFLISAGGGLSCQSVQASCFALPAAQVGPQEMLLSQHFSLSLGGCVFTDEESVILQNCYAMLRGVSDAVVPPPPVDKGDEASFQLPEIQADTSLSCADGSNGIVPVLDSDEKRIGQIVVGATGDPVLCKDLVAALGSTEHWPDMNGPLTEYGLGRVHNLGWKIKSTDPVPAEVLAAGSDTSLTVRVSYDDWSDSPAFFESSFEKEAEHYNSVELAVDQTFYEFSWESVHGTPRMLATKPKQRRRVRRGQMSGRSANAYDAKLGITVKVHDQDYAASKDTISMQLFKGVPCFDKAAENCTQEVASEMFQLGANWASGEERTFEKRVSSKLPKIAVPCSIKNPVNCFSAANLITSGRDGFRATISVAVLEDGDGRTKQDPDAKTIFTTSSSLKCEGSSRRGTLNCLMEVDAYVPPPEPETPEPVMSTPAAGHDGECVPHSDIACSTAPIAALPEISWKDGDPVGGGALRRVEYNFGPDPNTGGSAGWVLWVAKQTRSAVRFSYRVTADCGCYNRAHSFKVDKTYKTIQQTTGRAYPKYCLAPSRNFQPWNTNGMKLVQINAQCSSTLLYDRGHLVPANHLDHHKEAITESNYMINILPQVSTMNRQAWLATEEIVECTRDTVPLLVIGGAVFDESKLKKGTMGFNGYKIGQNTVKWEGDEAMIGRRRWFWDSHTGETPTYMWKIIQGALPKYGGKLVSITFWIPNTEEAVRGNLGKFAVSVEQLEELLQIHGSVTEKLHVAEEFNFMSKMEKAYFGDVVEWRSFVNGKCVQ